MQAVERLKRTIKARCVNAQETNFQDCLKAQDPRYCIVEKILRERGLSDSLQEIAEAFDKIRTGPSWTKPLVIFHEDTFFLDEVIKGNKDVLDCLRIINEEPEPWELAASLDRAKYEEQMDVYKGEGELKRAARIALEDLENAPTIKSCIERQSPALIPMLSYAKTDNQLVWPNFVQLDMNFSSRWDRVKREEIKCLIRLGLIKFCCLLRLRWHSK